jgi:hypothetical protein
MIVEKQGKPEFSEKTCPRATFVQPPSLCSFLNVRDRVSQPFKTKGKIIIFYILFFTLLDSKRERKMLWTERQQALSEFNLLLISSGT